MKYVLKIGIVFILLNTITFVASSQILSKKYIATNFSGKVYHAIIGEGRNYLTNDTEESFYNQVIIEFKKDKIFVKENQTKDSKIDGVISGDSIAYNYIIQDSIIRLNNKLNLEIKISKKPLKLFVYLPLYNLQFPLTEIAK